MQIDWPRYVRAAKEQGLTGIEVVQFFQKETNRKVNILKSSALGRNRIAHSRINAPGNPKLMHQRSLESFLFLC